MPVGGLRVNRLGYLGPSIFTISEQIPVYPPTAPCRHDYVTLPAGMPREVVEVRRWMPATAAGG